MRYLLLILLIFLFGCGESNEKKNRRVQCERYSSELKFDLNECIKNDKIFTDIQLKYRLTKIEIKIREFNNLVDKFNQTKMNINKEDYELVDIEKFIKQNDSLDGKRIKFNSYFEITEPENSGQEYTIDFENRFEVLISIIKKTGLTKTKLNSAKFQNVEILKKVKENLMPKKSIFFRKFSVPIGDDQSVFYGYFIKTESEVYSGIIYLPGDDKIKKSENNNEQENKETKKIYTTNFYVEEIELKKIDLDKQKIIEYFNKTDSVSLSLNLR
jgi:hypothetical protein